jgi:PleD family two-component response regulator
MISHRLVTTMDPVEPQRRWRILLIDDSEISLHFISSLLGRHGYDVRVSSTIDELGALDVLLRDWSPDLILTDVHMPGLSGAELCQRLKDRYETSEIPIVLFSSLSDAELEVLAHECAADAYLSKVNGLDRLPEELRALFETLVW